jgi:hypothetical protein
MSQQSLSTQLPILKYTHVLINAMQFASES